MLHREVSHDEKGIFQGIQNWDSQISSWTGSNRYPGELRSRYSSQYARAVEETVSWRSQFFISGEWKLKDTRWWTAAITERSHSLAGGAWYLKKAAAFFAKESKWNLDLDYWQQFPAILLRLFWILQALILLQNKFRLQSLKKRGAIAPLFLSGENPRSHSVCLSSLPGYGLLWVTPYCVLNCIHWFRCL